MHTKFQHLLRVVLAFAIAGGAISSAHAQQSCGAANADGVGGGDVLWKNNVSGQTVLWQMSGLSVQTSGSPGTVTDLNWKIVGRGDFDGDSRGDVLWQNRSTGQVVVWLMNGLTVLSSGSPGTVADLNWAVQGVGDFNADGKSDIFWKNLSTGQTVVWLMNGLTTLSSGSPGTVADLTWTIQAIGDFDGDGRADVFWKNLSGQTVVWLTGVGGLSVASSGSPGTVADSDWIVQGAGDFDGNGRADVLWKNSASGQTVVWLMNGLTTLSSGSPGTVADTNWVVHAIGDYDGDLRADIFWRNSVTGQTVSWLMDLGGLSISSSGSAGSVSDLTWQVQNCGAITPTLTASRVTGVAPLAVFFDASGTVVVNPQTKPFHDLEYRWNFGDPAGSPLGGTAWGNGSRSGADCSNPNVSCRNSTTGPIAAHLFENVGTFTITVTVTDGVSTAQKSIQVTTTSADSAFPATNTLCVSSNSTPVAGVGGCPSGASVLQQADFGVAMGGVNATGKRRVLFKRGDVFAQAAQGNGLVSVVGPGLIGAYGSGARPLIRPTFGNSSGNQPNLAFEGNPTRAQDWRVMDLEFNGSLSTPNTAIAGFTCNGLAAFDQFNNVNQITLLRIKVASNYCNAWLTHGGLELFVVDSDFTTRGYTSYNFRLSSSAHMGTSFTQTETADMGNANWRVEGHDGFVASNNTWTGGQTNRPQTKINGFSGPSQRLVFSDNKSFTGTGAFPFDIAPASAQANPAEVISDFIVERNWWIATGPSFRFVNISATKGTIRNNLFDTSANNNLIFNAPIWIAQLGTEPAPTSIRVYNNTGYSTASNGSGGFQYRFVNIDADGAASPSTNVVVRNNYVSAPGYTAPNRIMVLDLGVGTVQSDNTIVGTTAGFVNATPSLPADFKLGAGVAGNNSVPVFSDFFRSKRRAGAGMDQGAAEF